MRAVNAVNDVIAPLIKGMDASKQIEVDDAMLAYQGDGKAVLGGNATAAVSAAVLKAGAAALGIPLYEHIGGATRLHAARSRRDLPRRLRPLRAEHPLGRQADATRSWPTASRPSPRPPTPAGTSRPSGRDVLNKKFGVPKVGHGRRCRRSPPGVVKHDREIWDAMVETINRLGYEGKIGIQVDVATETYWDEDQQRYVGIFSAEPKTKEDIFELYLDDGQELPVRHHRGPVRRGRLRDDRAR